MKLFTVALTLLVTPVAFAAPSMKCKSSQTGYSYELDAAKKSVNVLDKKGNSIASASGLIFKDGQGEDIVLEIKTNDDSQVAIIGGEESLQGWFSHGMFESNLEDKALRCEIIDDKQAAAAIDPNMPCTTKNVEKLWDIVENNSIDKQTRTEAGNVIKRCLSEELKDAASEL